MEEFHSVLLSVRSRGSYYLKMFGKDPTVVHLQGCGSTASRQIYDLLIT